PGDNEKEKLAKYLKDNKAEKVIKAVAHHEIESKDYKDKIIKEMKAAKDSNDQPLDISKYGTSPGTIENPSEDAMVQFVYEQITGDSHKYVEKDKKKEETPSPST